MAKKVTHVEAVHGEKLVDDYFWLRDKKNPEVKAYLRRRERVRRRGHEADRGAPGEALRGDARPDQGDGPLRPVPRRVTSTTRARRRGSSTRSPAARREPEAPEEVVLDLNEIAKREKFVGRRPRGPDDGNLLAYTIDTTGFRQYTLHVKDLRRASSARHGREGVLRRLGGRQQDALLRRRGRGQAPLPPLPARAGHGSGPDTLVYEEKDERFNLGVSRSRSRWVLVPSGQPHAERVAPDPGGQPGRSPDGRRAAGEGPRVRRGPPRRPLLHPDERRLPRLPRRDGAGREPGQGVVEGARPLPPGVMVSGLDAFANHLVCSSARTRCRASASSTSRRGRTASSSRSPSTRSPQSNPEYDTKTFRFSYQSFTTPPTVYDYDMATTQRTLLKRTEVLGGYDPSRYQSERLYATATDGTKIPISSSTGRTSRGTARAPLFLNGYGSYGALHRCDVQLQPVLASRPRRRLRGRARPRRRRDGKAVARRRAG